ncbi:hypothetical protein CRYUN_Cryun24cG0044000 [Craigia yunnanensis]
MNIVSWQPPPSNVLKLNANASFDQTTRIAGLGVVIRDEQRSVVLSASAKMSSISNSLYAEVLAILFGIKLMLERGLLFVIVESDSLVTINLVNW